MISFRPAVEPQLRAAARSPVHAYLFVGPPGTGKAEAALSFAASILCDRGGCGTCPGCVAVLARRHPDVEIFERSGAAITVEDSREIVRRSLLSPRSAARRVLILSDIHLAELSAPALLKSIEEPPETTIFVILAELVPTMLATIASRCVRIDFPPLGEAETVDALVAGGVDPDTARLVAPAAGGRLDRARLLARDPGFAARHALWQGVPDRLDGTGATVAATAAALLASTDEVVGVLRRSHAEELQALAEKAKEAGERSGGAPVATLERHRREERRAKTDELKSGLATLAATYRDRAIRGGLPAHRMAAVLGGAEAIDEAGAALTVNSGDRLVLEALLVRLSGGA